MEREETKENVVEEGMEEEEDEVDGATPRYAHSRAALVRRAVRTRAPTTFAARWQK